MVVWCVFSVSRSLLKFKLSSLHPLFMGQPVWWISTALYTCKMIKVSIHHAIFIMWIFHRVRRENLVCIIIDIWGNVYGIIDSWFWTCVKQNLSCNSFFKFWGVHIQGPMMTYDVIAHYPGIWISVITYLTEIIFVFLVDIFLISYLNFYLLTCLCRVFHLPTDCQLQEENYSMICPEHKVRIYWNQTDEN